LFVSSCARLRGRARLFDALRHKPFSIEALMQVIAGAQDSVDASASLAA
jgi:hypothetical protein